MKVLTFSPQGFEVLAQQYETRALAELAEAARCAGQFDLLGYRSHMTLAELQYKQADDIRKLSDSIHGRKS